MGRIQNRKLAEGEGFEPPVTCATTVFKTAALNRSATPPRPLSHPQEWTAGMTDAARRRHCSTISSSEAAIGRRTNFEMPASQ